MRQGGIPPAAPSTSPLRAGLETTQSQQGKQLEDLQVALDARADIIDTASYQALHRRLDMQQRVIDELKQASSSAHAMQLTRDLEHSRSLVADLQVALRAQEGSFHEMLRAQESLRVVEDLRSVTEKQLHAMREERDRYKEQLAQRDAEVISLKEDLKKQEEQHKEEMEVVRKSFVQYDENVGSYLENIRAERRKELEEFMRAQQAAALSGSTPAPQAPHYDPNGGVHTPSQAVRVPGGVAKWMQDLTHQTSRPAPPAPSVPPAPAPTYGIPPDALTDALLKHLNNYANLRYQLPSGHPLPAMVLQSRNEPNAPTGRYAEAMPPARYDAPNVRDRSIL